MKNGELEWSVGWNTVDILNKSGWCEKKAGEKTVAVRCNVCDEQGRGEEEGQLWSAEIAKLKRSNGMRGVGGLEQRGFRLVVFSTLTVWGRGLAIISDTTDNRSTSPYHYLFVLLGYRFPAETPLISLSDSRNSLFSFNSHLSLSTFKTPPSSLFPHCSIVFFFSSLLSHILISCTFCFLVLLCFPASLVLSSQAPFLFLPLCIFAFPLTPPLSHCLYEPAGRLCGASWSRGSWAWLNCSKIAASLRRLHYLSSAAPHCVGMCVCVCIWEMKGGWGSVWQDWMCMWACMDQTCCHQQYQPQVNHV